MQLSIIKEKKEGKIQKKCDQCTKILVGKEELAGAAIQRCSVNKAFWRNVEN